MKRGAALALWALTLLAVALFAFVLGRSTAPAFPLGETFYATVDRVEGDSLAVTGLEVNDVNHRGAFTFSVEEDTVLEWRHAPIALAELEPQAAENDAWSAEDYGEKFQALRLSVRSEEGLSTPEAQAYYEDCQTLLERLEQNEPLVIEEDPPWMDELLSELEEEQAQA